MEETLWRLVAQYGLPAALFVSLLMFVLRENTRRENRLMTFMESVGPTMTKLCERLDSVVGITKRIEHKVDGCDRKKGG